MTIYHQYFDGRRETAHFDRPQRKMRPFSLLILVVGTPLAAHIISRLTEARSAIVPRAIFITDFKDEYRR